VVREPFVCRLLLCDLEDALRALLREGCVRLDEHVAHSLSHANVVSMLRLAGHRTGRGQRLSAGRVAQGAQASVSALCGLLGRLVDWELEFGVQLDLHRAGAGPSWATFLIASRHLLVPIDTLELLHVLLAGW